MKEKWCGRTAGAVRSDSLCGGGTKPVNVGWEKKKKGPGGDGRNSTLCAVGEGMHSSKKLFLMDELSEGGEPLPVEEGDLNVEEKLQALPLIRGTEGTAQPKIKSKRIQEKKKSCV